MSKSRCQGRLHDIITDAVNEAGPGGGVESYIDSVNESDFISRNTLGQFGAANGEEF
jgi:hypothetical protein